MGADHATIFEEIHESRLYPIDHRTPLNGLPTRYNAIGLHRILLVLLYLIQLHSFYFNSDTAASIITIITILIIIPIAIRIYETKHEEIAIVRDQNYPLPASFFSRLALVYF